MSTAAVGQSSTSVPTSAPAESRDDPIKIDTQHDDMVHDCQLDYYGVKLATSSSDRTVKIFDVTGSTYTHTATLQGHEGPVWQISWSHPKFGSVLASCSFDGSVLFHRESRPREWTLLHAARGLHESSVNGVAFASHGFGLVAAAAGSDGRVSVLTHREDDSWDVEYVRVTHSVLTLLTGPLMTRTISIVISVMESMVGVETLVMLGINPPRGPDWSLAGVTITFVFG